VREFWHGTGFTDICQQACELRKRTLDMAFSAYSPPGPRAATIRRDGATESLRWLLAHSSGAVCCEPWAWRATRGRDLAGRARNAPRRGDRWAVARRSHSMAAWCGAPLARRCPALYTVAGRGWLCACARRRAAGRTYPVPRKQSGDATRRRDPACKRPRALLLPAVHPRPRIRADVCPRRLI
jgi:hypothetical protein